MNAQYNILIAQDMARSMSSETYCLMLYFVIEDKILPSVGLLPPKQDYLESSQNYKTDSISSPQKSTIRQQHSCNQPSLSKPWCHTLGETAS